MLKRNVFSWIKFSILPLVAGVMLVGSSAQAQFVLVDDFQALAVDDLIEGTTGPGATWTGNMSATNSAQEDPDCAANIVMRQSGAPGGAPLRAALDQADNIDIGATGTLFYRFRTPESAVGTLDHVVGLTDNPDITNFDFKPGLRIITPTPGANQLDLRDGLNPGYEAVTDLLDNTWYKLWMVAVNTNPGVHMCYLQSDDDPAFATQSLLVSGGDPFDFRIMGTTPIVNVYFRNANNNGGIEGNDLFIDDVYVNPTAADLTDPSFMITDCDPAVGVLLGDVNLSGAVTFDDIGPFIAVLQSGGNQAEADCNQDGMVDFGDIAFFITILQAQ